MTVEKEMPPSALPCIQQGQVLNSSIQLQCDSPPDSQSLIRRKTANMQLSFMTCTLLQGILQNCINYQTIPYIKTNNDENNFRRNFIKSKRNEPKLLHSRRIRLPHQIEPAMAYQYGLPLLLIKEKGVAAWELEPCGAVIFYH
ncbi:hypothetical protein FLT15_02835 [Paenibacillus thiaminolyticus]|uniref:hypothetical protein n=1 Tax=Paenibacillus thiaminolyticus TaxID=49283 RepID=UPI001162A9E3|nr:hypothetical protein [Paenibacillus thiaminolyticus]NGP57353.1 hypothetical protein [Paenibacillus thiaminolyticus]